MKEENRNRAILEYAPLTPDRWADFERLFGKQGGYSGCWCMWWRITRSQFEKNGSAGNREAMRRIVSEADVPGILAYSGSKPVGWCSVAPRESFASLNRSPVLKRLDDRPVWSIVCFYIAKEHRAKGVMFQLIRAAIDYVRSQGAHVIEAYPTVARTDRLPPASSFMGVPAVFEKAGFMECSRPSETKVIMRYNINPNS